MQSLVLSTLRYADDAFIARLFTEEEGCLSFYVRRPKTRRKSSGGYLLLQPLSLLDVEWRHQANTSKLLHPQHIRAHYTYATIPQDDVKRTVALFLAEFLGHALGAEPPSPALFAFLRDSLLWYDAADGARTANFHLVFLLRLSRFLGFYPQAQRYHAGHYFDMQESTFCPAPPAHAHYLAPEDAAVLPQLMRLRYETMHLLRLTGRERSRLLSLIVDYYRLHLPSFPELNSLSVLREVFA